MGPGWPSKALNFIAPDDSMASLSPVQIDYLISQYFGWIGASANGIVDIIINPDEKPTKYWHEYQPVRRFYQDLP